MGIFLEKTPQRYAFFSFIEHENLTFLLFLPIFEGAKSRFLPRNPRCGGHFLHHRPHGLFTKENTKQACNNCNNCNNCNKCNMPA